jgi:hypothetical protein
MAALDDSLGPVALGVCQGLFGDSDLNFLVVPDAKTSPPSPGALRSPISEPCRQGKPDRTDSAKASNSTSDNPTAQPTASTAGPTPKRSRSGMNPFEPFAEGRPRRRLSSRSTARLRRWSSLISSTTLTSAAPTRRKHSLTKAANGLSLRLSSACRAVRGGSSPVASIQAVRSKIRRFRSASRLGKFLWGSGANRRGFKAGRERLPDALRRPSTGIRPNEQSRSICSQAELRNATF